MCRGRPLGQLGVVTDIMQSTSGWLLLQCGGENLSLPRPKTFTAVEESGKGISGGLAGLWWSLVTIDQGPTIQTATCLNEPASSFPPTMNGP